MNETITITRGTHTGVNNELAKSPFQSNTEVWGPLSFSKDWTEDINWEYSVRSTQKHPNTKPCAIKLDIKSEDFDNIKNYLLLYHSDFPEMRGREGCSQIRPPSWEYLKKYKGEILLVKFPGFDDFFTPEKLREMKLRVKLSEDGKYKDYDEWRKELGFSVEGEDTNR